MRSAPLPIPPESTGPASTQRFHCMGPAEFKVVFAEWQQKISRTLGSSKTPWAIVGIKRRGAVLARRLCGMFQGEGSSVLHYGEIDISLYRDDYHLRSSKPMVLGSEITFRVEGLNILLVDDVLFSGRTVRAALDLILDFGRPRQISLAVFIDRGYRELPIAANVVGREIATEPGDQVLVTLEEMGETDGVDLLRKNP